MRIDPATRAAAHRIASILGDCAVSLTGSRRYGYATDDSDIDLFVFLPDHKDVPVEGARVLHQTRDVTVLEVSMAGAVVQMTVFSYVWLHAVLDTPWKAYNVMDSSILHDPDGRLSTCRERLRSWYDQHPDAVAAWQKQQESLRTCRGRTHGERMSARMAQLRFPTPMAFAKHLDTLFASRKKPNTAEGDRDRSPSSLRGPSHPTERTDRVLGESAASEPD